MISVKKTTKYLFKNPIQLITNSLSDYKKDNSKIKLVFNKVWCIGLPKSGTTLIENILEQLPYVEMFSSVFRKWENTDPNYMFDLNVPEKLFRDMPDAKNTYFKTHTKYSKLTREIIENNNIKVIISIRDLRDMMISRYYHIMSLDTHWQHNSISKLNFKEGFKISLINKKNDHELNPLNYYYFWIKNWVEYVKEKRNILILNYDEYVKNKENYISKILHYLEIEKKIFNFEKYNSKKIKKNELSKSLNNFGRNKSTFRSGKKDQWQSLFDDDITKFFFDNLPENNLEKLKY